MIAQHPTDERGSNSSGKARPVLRLCVRCWAHELAVNPSTVCRWLKAAGVPANRGVTLLELLPALKVMISNCPPATYDALKDVDWSSLCKELPKQSEKE